MPKTKISEFSATPGNNTDIDGINLAEGCAPSGINDAIRELMAQLKDFQTGAAGDSFNGPVNGAINGTVGATTPNTGAFTTLSASGAFSLTGDQVQVSEGGTGATTASGARTNLGLAIGTNVQAYDAQLDTLSGASADRATFLASDQGFGFRNRIINGDMRIDQRRSGSALTPAANGDFIVDRFAFSATQASRFFGGQNYNSVTPPTGFTNYAGVQCSTSQSLAASDFFGILQRIEGFNTADLAWGSANAQPVTLTFRVYSSLTGTFGGSLQNSGGSRSYPFSYSIASANTWTTVSVTISGDTTGTWLTNNGQSIQVFFGLGVGSTFSGTAGAWAGSNLLAPTGAVSVVGTAFATFYITGVQLEAGSVATPFERRDYGRELIMCQRYYYKSFSQVIGAANLDAMRGVISTSGFRASHIFKHAVTMRAAPSVVLYNPVTGAAGSARNEDAATNVTPTPYAVNQETVSAIDVSGSTSGQCITMAYTASAEL